MSSDDDRDQSDFLTVQQVAKKIGYSERSVLKFLKEERLQGQKIEGGRKWRVTPEAVDQFLSARDGPRQMGEDQQRGDHLHHEELQSLLSKWREIQQENMTLDLWLNLVTYYMLSPSALLNWAQGISRSLGQDQSVEPAPCSM